MNKENKKQMKSLKEKEKSNVILSNSDNTRLFYYQKEDVKEAVLKYEEFMKDLENIGKEISKEEFNKKWNILNDCSKNYYDIYKEIFGDFKK